MYECLYIAYEWRNGWRMYTDAFVICQCMWSEWVRRVWLRLYESWGVLLELPKINPRHVKGSASLLLHHIQTFLFLILIFCRLFFFAFKLLFLSIKKKNLLIRRFALSKGKVPCRWIKWPRRGGYIFNTFQNSTMEESNPSFPKCLRIKTMTFIWCTHCI